MEGMPIHLPLKQFKKILKEMDKRKELSSDSLKPIFFKNPFFNKLEPKIQEGIINKSQKQLENSLKPLISYTSEDINTIEQFANVKSFLKDIKKEEKKLKELLKKEAEPQRLLQLSEGLKFLASLKREIVKEKNNLNLAVFSIMIQKRYISDLFLNQFFTSLTVSFALIFDALIISNYYLNPTSIVSYKGTEIFFTACANLIALLLLYTNHLAKKTFSNLKKDAEKLLNDVFKREVCSISKND